MSTSPTPRDGVDGLFRSETGFWIIASVLFGEVSLLKGLRYPNVWAATLAQIDYSQGFTKRGLFGAVVTPLLGLNRYGRFAVVSEAFLFALLALVALYTHRSGVIIRLGSGVPVAVFFASYAVTYVAHIVGYLDIPLACLTVGVLLVRKDQTRFLIAVPVTVMALFMHELFLIVFLPQILLSFLLSGFAAETGKKRNVEWLRATLLMATAVAVCAFLVLRPSLDGNAAARLQSHVTGNTDFQTNPAVFRVFVLSLSDNLQAMSTYFADAVWQHDQLVSAFVFFPTVGALLWCAWQLLSAAHHRFRKRAMALAALCTFAPLLMHLVGWDAGRWNALTAFEAFLTLLTVGLFTEGDAVSLSATARNAMILVIGLSLASGGVLMDHAQARFFPFF